MSGASLANKVIVVIGGTTGLGLSAARAMLVAGARGVVITGRNTDNAASAAAGLGPSCAALAGDAKSAAHAVDAIALARERFDRFDALYHVAGGSGRRMGDGPLHEMTDDGL